MLPCVKLIAITKVLIEWNALFHLTQIKKIPMTYYHPRTIKPCHVVIHKHKDRTDNINLLEIAKEFVSFNDRKMSVYYFLIMDYMQLNKYKMVKYLTVKNEHLSKLAIVTLLILVMTRSYQEVTYATPYCMIITHILVDNFK